MRAFTTLTVEQLDHVRRVTLNRPEQHNPLTPRSIREIVAAVDQAASDRETRVVIIRSTGRSFSSGYGFIAEDMDPGDFEPHQSVEGDVTAMLELARDWATVWDCAIPVIAQVQGNCLAGGPALRFDRGRGRRSHRFSARALDGRATDEHVALSPGPTMDEAPLVDR